MIETCVYFKVSCVNMKLSKIREYPTYLRLLVIISLLIEKLFYLLRPQSFSFQIVSEFIDTFVKFLTLCPGDGAFDSLFCPEGRDFVQNDCLGGGEFLLPSSRIPGGWFWMKLVPA